MLPAAIRVRRSGPGQQIQGRTVLLCSSPGPPLLRVFPEAPAGEVQVARRPRLTPHKQTWLCSGVTPSGPGTAHDRELTGSREAAGCEVPVAAEAPRPALRSFNPRRGARDDDEAGKVRRARREAAWHAQCSRLWVFSEVAQTLLGRRVYSAEGNPAAARCSSRPGRIRAPRPARTRPAPPARPLRTLS